MQNLHGVMQVFLLWLEQLFVSAKVCKNSPLKQYGKKFIAGHKPTRCPQHWLC